MPYSIDNWKSQLLMARLLFQHADSHRSPPTHLNRVVAIVGYHSAVEMALKAIADKKDIQPARKDFTILELLNATTKGLTERLAGKIRITDVQRVASARNNAVHHGTPPSEEAVEEARQAARQFMIAALKAVFNLEFETLEVFDFIQSERAKVLLRISNDNLNGQSFYHSRVPAKLAFQMFFNNYLKLIGKGIRFRHFSATSNVKARATQPLSQSEEVIVTWIDELYAAVADEFEETKALSGLAGLGYTIDQVEKYSGVAGNISFRIGGVTINRETGTTNTRAQSELSRWFIDFIADAVLRFEQIGIRDEPLDYLQPWYDEVVDKKGIVFS